MIDPARLNTLSAVLRLGSFEAAAAQLGVTPSAVSQRIKALEEQLGTALVIRDQPARATPAGARLARHAEDLRLLEQALADEIGRQAQGALPTVRIAVNADSLATWFLPALAEVPGLLYDLVIDDQDHSADWLRRGEVQAAVTSHAAPVAGCDCVALGALRYVATATPAFAARWFPDGPTAAAFRAAPSLVFNQKDRLQTDWAARVAGEHVVLPAHRLASSQGFVEAARLGLGWGMNPEALVAGDLACGRLVALAPDAALDVALCWQTGRLTGRALSPLTRAVRRHAARLLRGA